MRSAIGASQRAAYSALAAQLWLGLRLQVLGVLVVTAVAFIAVLQRHFATVDPGLVGLGLAYALSVTGILSGLLSSFTETEKELVSVERIHHYVTQPPKEPQEGSLMLPPHWPANGRVEFRSVRLRYLPSAPPALHGLSFEVRQLSCPARPSQTLEPPVKVGPGERVGIVGRTGSGKSSILNALFQATAVESGSVLVDSVDVSLVGPAALRSRLALIPQTPLLITGTLRDNLDVFGEYSIETVSGAVAAVGLGAVAGKLGGLEASVGERGAGLSVGERQLVCLARALLRRSRIVCLDEATAHVDGDTDDQIQAVLLGPAFAGATLLTIAHRLASLRDYDRVLVLDRGRLREQGSPDQVLRSQDPIDQEM